MQNISFHVLLVTSYIQCAQLLMTKLNRESSGMKAHQNRNKKLDQEYETRLHYVRYAPRFSFITPLTCNNSIKVFRSAVYNYAVNVSRT